jgi:hypothetical protein
MLRSLVCAAAVVSVAPGATFAQSPTPAAPAASAADGWVVLTVPDYLALRDKANPRGPDPVRPPARATITEIAYTLAAGEGLALGTAELTIDVLEDGWVEVPIPQGLVVRAARLGGRPLPLADLAGGRGGPGRRILLSRKGRTQVSLDVAVPIETPAAGELLRLPPSPGGLVHAVLTVPRAGEIDLSAFGGAVIAREATPQALRVTAHATLNEALGFTWHRRREVAEGALPLRLRGRVQHVIGLGEETGFVTARVTADVAQGGTSALALRLPDGLIVNQVQGAHVADWDVRDGVLAINLLERVDRQTAVVVTGEFHPPASGRVELPLVRLTGAEREAGAVAVEVLGAGEVTARDARGLDPADASELGDLLAGRTSPAIVAFRYRGDQPAAARGLALTLTRYTPQEVLLAAVDEARYRAVVAEDGKALVEARLAVRNNQRSFLALTLPTGATLWSVTIDGRPVRPGVGPQGSLLIPLQKRRAGSEAARVVVGLMYVDKAPAWDRGGDWRLTLPAVDLPVQQVGLTVHHSPRYRLTALPGDFHVQPEPPLSAALTLDEEKGVVSSRDAQGDFARPGARQEAAGSGAAGPPPLAPEPAARLKAGREDDTLGGLVDRFQKEARGVRSVGTLPVMVAFPDTGPGLYLAAELTAEGAAPSAAFTFKREGK